MIETRASSSARVWHISLAALCVSIVAVSAFFDPLTGKCGTGPYVIFQMSGGLLAGGIKSICSMCGNDVLLLQRASAIVVNVGFFSTSIALLYWKGTDYLPTQKPSASTSRTWFVPAVLAWTGFYVASYLFLFPAQSCP
jgi:hypothetical protein